MSSSAQTAWDAPYVDVKPATQTCGTITGSQQIADVRFPAPAFSII